MKICYYPRYSIEQAASRLRVYWIQEYLINRGVNATLKSSPLTSDIIVFERVYEPFYDNLAKYAKTRNIKIVVDIDDPMIFPSMFRIADKITCDTEDRAEYIRERFSSAKDKLKVIEDPIDYLKKPLPKREHRKTDNLNLVYFAGPQNVPPCFPLIKKSLKKLRKKFTLTIITGEKFNLSFPYTFLKWNLRTFSEELRKFDLCLMPQVEIEKSSTKLTQAIAHNIPVLASNIPAYYKICKATKTLDSLASTEEEWDKALEKGWDPDWRNSYLKKTQNYVWKHFGIEAKGREWLEFFKELVKN